MDDLTERFVSFIVRCCKVGPPDDPRVVSLAVDSNQLSTTSVGLSALWQYVAKDTAKRQLAEANETTFVVAVDNVSAPILFGLRMGDRWAYAFQDVSKMAHEPRWLIWTDADEAAQDMPPDPASTEFFALHHVMGYVLRDAKLDIEEAVKASAGEAGSPPYGVRRIVCLKQQNDSDTENPDDQSAD